MDNQSITSTASPLDAAASELRDIERTLSDFGVRYGFGVVLTIHRADVPDPKRGAFKRGELHSCIADSELGESYIAASRASALNAAMACTDARVEAEAGVGV